MQDSVTRWPNEISRTTKSCWVKLIDSANVCCRCWVSAL